MRRTAQLSLRRLHNGTATDDDDDDDTPIFTQAASNTSARLIPLNLILTAHHTDFGAQITRPKNWIAFYSPVVVPPANKAPVYFPQEGCNLLSIAPPLNFVYFFHCFSESRIYTADHHTQFNSLFFFIQHCHPLVKLTKLIINHPRPFGYKKKVKQVSIKFIFNSTPSGEEFQNCEHEFTIMGELNFQMGSSNVALFLSHNFYF